MKVIRVCFALVLVIIFVLVFIKARDVKRASINMSSIKNNIDEPKYSETKYGLVRLLDLYPDFIIDLGYFKSDNFTGQQIYTKNEAYLHKDVARKLVLVAQECAKKNLKLKIFDAYRPLSAQKKMWKIMPDERYVGNPVKGGYHTRGAAVDLTLVDSNTGLELEMPCPIDTFDERAHRNYSKLSNAIRANVEYLESVMHKHGFIGFEFEWWHFNDKDIMNYPVLDVDFELLSL